MDNATPPTNTVRHTSKQARAAAALRGMREQPSTSNVNRRFRNQHLARIDKALKVLGLDHEEGLELPHDGRDYVTPEVARIKDYVMHMSDNDDVASPLILELMTRRVYLETSHGLYLKLPANPYKADDLLVNRCHEVLDGLMYNAREYAITSRSLDDHTLDGNGSLGDGLRKLWNMSNRVPHSQAVLHEVAVRAPMWDNMRAVDVVGKPYEALMVMGDPGGKSWDMRAGAYVEPWDMARAVYEDMGWGVRSSAIEMFVKMKEQGHDKGLVPDFVRDYWRSRMGMNFVRLIAVLMQRPWDKIGFAIVDSDLGLADAGAGYGKTTGILSLSAAFAGGTMSVRDRPLDLYSGGRFDALEKDATTYKLLFIDEITQYPKGFEALNTERLKKYTNAKLQPEEKHEKRELAKKPDRTACLVITGAGLPDLEGSTQGIKRRVQGVNIFKGRGEGSGIVAKTIDNKEAVYIMDNEEAQDYAAALVLMECTRIRGNVDDWKAQLHGHGDWEGVYNEREVREADQWVTKHADFAPSFVSWAIEPDEEAEGVLHKDIKTLVEHYHLEMLGGKGKPPSDAIILHEIRRSLSLSKSDDIQLKREGRSWDAIPRCRLSGLAEKSKGTDLFGCQYIWGNEYRKDETCEMLGRMYNAQADWQIVKDGRIAENLKVCSYHHGKKADTAKADKQPTKKTFQTQVKNYEELNRPLPKWLKGGEKDGA